MRAAIDPAAGDRPGRARRTGRCSTWRSGRARVTLPAGVPPAADEAALATCTSAGRLTPLPGGATRVRISAAGGNDGVYQAGALTLHHHAVGPVRVRWDVVVVP